jgi:ribosomal protein L16
MYESDPSTLDQPLTNASARTPHHLANRAFSTTNHHLSWLLPKSGAAVKTRKGRPRVPTGGSTRGTTVVWGDYGLRMVDHHRRISAAQLKNGEETIRKRLRGLKFRFYTRVCANIGVFTSGNEVRMGKGKGSFDYWACRVANNRIIFEMKGDLHEQVARDAFRLAANKLPGI